MTKKLNQRKVILRIESSSIYGRGLLRGIGKYANLYRNWVFYRESPYYRKSRDLQKEVERMQKWGADGIIIRETQGFEQLIKLNVPVIVCPNITFDQELKDEIKNFPSILTDCRQIGIMAAEHLLDRGFSNFAFCGFEELEWSQRRRQSFTNRIQQAGHDVLYFNPSPNRKKGSWLKEQQQMIEWLKSLPRPTGLMAANDDRGLDVIEACKQAGIYIPEEISIIGVDNDEIACEVFNPPLSSIAINTIKAGYEAAELLDNMMSGKKITKDKILVTPKFVISRQSTDILAIEDNYVAEAVNFIRQNCQRPLQVNDVVEAVSLSRRGLEKRFRTTLGRSVLVEIRRMRVAKITQMLLETNLSVSKIALTFGFGDAHNISRYFKKETGMSLIQFRKKYGFN